MYKSIYRSRVIFSALLLFFVLSAGVKDSKAQAELVVNGGFEDGDFTGWTKAGITGSGDWFIYSGAPLGLLPPPDGEFAVVTNQTDRDSNILYQDISIPQGSKVTCTAIVYLRNASDGTYIIGDGLTIDSSNQQMRVDIMDPEADPFDTGAGVLENLFQTLPGDPNQIGYTTLEFDLTQFAGTTVRFRAAVVVTQNILNGSIDAVSCIALSSENIPTLSEWGMISAAAGLGLIGVFFALRKRKVKAI
jgi:hypothetical protein